MKTLDQFLKRPLLLSLAMLSLVTLGAYVAYFVLASRQSGSHGAVADVYIRRNTPGGSSIPVMPDELDAAFRARSLELRDIWREWAYAHRVTIAKMSHSSDIADLNAVYNALPDWPEEVSKNLVLERHPADFCWNRDPRKKTASPAVMKNPAWKKLFESENVYLKERRQQEFDHFHDFSFAQSINQGTTNYLLWVSGRITKQTKDPGGPEVVTEVAPRFDFTQ